LLHEHFSMNYKHADMNVEDRTDTIFYIEKIKGKFNPLDLFEIETNAYKTWRSYCKKVFDMKESKLPMMKFIHASWEFLVTANWEVEEQERDRDDLLKLLKMDGCPLIHFDTGNSDLGADLIIVKEGDFNEGNIRLEEFGYYNESNAKYKISIDPSMLEDLDERCIEDDGD